MFKTYSIPEKSNDFCINYVIHALEDHDKAKINLIKRQIQLPADFYFFLNKPCCKKHNILPIKLVFPSPHGYLNVIKKNKTEKHEKCLFF